MEMPEGWRKLNADLNDAGKMIWPDEYLKALDLMKEMAEALEDGDQYNRTAILKKFKEWK